MKVLHILPLIVLLLVSPHLRAAELEELIGRVKEATNTLDSLAMEQDTVKKLQEIGPRAIPLLLPLLRDQKQTVRELAAFTLRDMRGLTEEHLDALIGAYRRGDSSLPSVIARIGTPKAVDFLVEGFIQERQPKAPFSDAIEVLGEKAFPQLLRVYDRDKGWDEKLEETMLWSLQSLGPKAGRAIDPLLQRRSRTTQRRPRKSAFALCGVWGRSGPRRRERFPILSDCSGTKAPGFARRRRAPSCGRERMPGRRSWVAWLALGVGQHRRDSLARHRRAARAGHSGWTLCRPLPHGVGLGSARRGGFTPWVTSGYAPATGG